MWCDNKNMLRDRVEAQIENAAARLKSVAAIADTGLVPSLLATPI